MGPVGAAEPSHESLRIRKTGEEVGQNSGKGKNPKTFLPLRFQLGPGKGGRLTLLIRPDAAVPRGSPFQNFAENIGQLGGGTENCRDNKGFYPQSRRVSGGDWELKFGPGGHQKFRA